MKKKVKKYAEGGLAGIAETAESLMGDVDSMADTVNYGSSTPTMGNLSPFNPNEIAAFKKGGEVFSPSKRIDGCAIRGKTKGRMITMASNKMAKGGVAKIGRAVKRKTADVKGRAMKKGK
jgi:hypothetical protein